MVVGCYELYQRDQAVGSVAWVFLEIIQFHCGDGGQVTQWVGPL